jgi:hypothetical protein
MGIGSHHHSLQKYALLPTLISQAGWKIWIKESCICGGFSGRMTAVKLGPEP